MTSSIRTGEYTARGDYHRKLDPNWSYYPIYIRKMAWIERYMSQHVPKTWRILDAGCGEGVLVEKLAVAGYQAFGLDFNYGSLYVHQGDIYHLPYAANTFDLILCLDVLEHLDLLSQQTALQEIARVLKSGGHTVFTIPNLAHLQSRLNFLFRGQFLRTSVINKHPGDRPIQEYLNLMQVVGFEIIERRGIKLTLPQRLVNILGHALANKLMFAASIHPSLCLLNLIVCRKARDT